MSGAKDILVMLFAVRIKELRIEQEFLKSYNTDCYDLTLVEWKIQELTKAMLKAGQGECNI